MSDADMSRLELEAEHDPSAARVLLARARRLAGETAPEPKPKRQEPRLSWIVQDVSSLIPRPDGTYGFGQHLGYRVLGIQGTGNRAIIVSQSVVYPTREQAEARCREDRARIRRMERERAARAAARKARQG